MKRKLFAFFIAVSVLLVFAACGSPAASSQTGDDSGSSGSPDQTEETDALQETEDDATLGSLLEYTIDGWDTTKKIYNIISDDSNENILTEDHIFFYNEGTYSEPNWIENENIRGIGDEFQAIGVGSELFNGEDLYAYNPPQIFGEMPLVKLEFEPAVKVKKIGKGLDANCFYILDDQGNFKVYRKHNDSETIFYESPIPTEMEQSGVKDILDEYYLTNNGELRSFPVLFNDQDIQAGTVGIGITYDELLVSTDVKAIFDAKQIIGGPIFILYDNNELSYLDTSSDEEKLLTVSSDIGEIEQIVGDKYNFIVLTDNGEYYQQNDESLEPVPELNEIKDRIESLAIYSMTVLVILDNGKVYYAN